MQMTNTELAELLNARIGLTGRDAVTANVVRQWVDWDVLPKATAQGRAIGKGPAWSRSGTALRLALRLGELRKCGIKRGTALIVQAYIEWGHSDFDRVKEALLSEWAKWAAQLTRRQTTFLGNFEFREISATKQKAIAAQIGPLDPIFEGTQFEQSPELYAAIAEFARTGEGNTGYVESLISGASSQIWPGATDTLAPDCMSVLANSFSGMTGDPDEIGNSGESAIQNSSERQFRISRHQIRLLLRELGKPGRHRQITALDFRILQLLQTLHSLTPQISTGPWLIFLFVQALKIPHFETSVSLKTL